MTASPIEPAGTCPPARRRVRLRWGIVATLLPTLAFLAVFAFYPALSGPWHSLFDWRPGFDSPFVGFKNYATVFSDVMFWRSFANLGVIFLVDITMKWLLPLIAAELLITVRSERARTVYRVLLLFPMAFPGVVTALVWSFLYNPNDGMINRLLETIGLGEFAHNWVGDPNTALAALLFIGVPWVAGLPFLVFTTGLQNIPDEIFEAARLDGVGRIRRFFLIDVPLLASQLRLLLFLVMAGILQFGMLAYLTTGGGPDGATEVPVLQLIGQAFQGQNWGYAAALSSILFVLGCGLSSFVLFLRRKGGEIDVQL
ncbi:MAG: sugar ABC transporter permease [Microbacterium sp.]|uniref:carbohydrate ABC transporter permease n=1 Tax=Microbacterium sp. TaxID=51671 RepID=UPI0039E39ADC